MRSRKVGSEEQGSIKTGEPQRTFDQSAMGRRIYVEQSSPANNFNAYIFQLSPVGKDAKDQIKIDKPERKTMPRFLKRL